MPDSQLPDAEPGVQLSFILPTLGAGIFLALAVLLFQELYRFVPNRIEVGQRTVAITIRDASLDPAGFAPLRLAGAWQISADDARFGGISAIEVDGGDLLAVTDSGVTARFPKPGGGSAASALIRELPDGPGDARFKRRRDSEALLSDPGGRGWWVGFEFVIQAWLYDHDLRRVLGRIALPRKVWPRTGFEAAVFDGQDLLMFPESGGKVLVVEADGRLFFRPVTVGSVSDGKKLSDGTIMLVERRVTPGGFANALVRIDGRGGGYRVLRRYPLGVRRIDNVEGLAVERKPGGRERLWLVTDDDFEWPMRTLLVAVDMPGGR